MTTSSTVFHTRGAANDGIELPLSDPNGKLTKHWIRIRGVDSDAFRVAESKAKRNAIELALIEDDQTRAEAVRTIELGCIAALVISWSFEDEIAMSESAVIEFLREAPQIADMINKAAARRASFFAQGSRSSLLGSKKKRRSKRSQRGRNKT